MNQEEAKKLIAEINQMTPILLDYLERVISKIFVAAEYIYNELWNMYGVAGYPYGESHEGLMKWLESKGKSADLAEDQ